MASSQASATKSAPAVASCAIATALGDTSALVLVTVNVTSILAAFLLGYFAHDPDKHFDKAFEKHRSAQRAVEKQDRTFKAKS